MGGCRAASTRRPNSGEVARVKFSKVERLELGRTVSAPHSAVRGRRRRGARAGACAAGARRVEARGRSVHLGGRSLRRGSE